MRKIFFLFVLFSLFWQPLFSQVDDIRENAKKHKNRSSSNDQKSSSNTDNDGCSEGCFEGCFQFVFSEFIQLLYSHHVSLMDSRETNPTVLSLDVMPHLGFSPDNKYVDYLGRLRGTWGVLSTDVRLNYLTEYKNFSTSNYKTIDWQILSLNFMFSDNFNFRVGTGIMYDDFIDKSFNQHFVGAELRMNNQAALLTFEGRFTYNYDNSEDNEIYNEFNLRTAFRVVNTKHLWMYANFGFLWQKYYQAVELWSLQSGVSINIH